MTIEAALLMPLLLLVVMITLYLFFYVHNKVWLTAAAYEAALDGSLETARPEGKSRDKALKKGKELGKGISQRKDGIYQARFINRFGKQQTIYAGTYTDITKKLRTEMYMDEKQINVVNSTMTLDEWYDSWINVCKTHCRDTTKRTYAIQYNRLREELGWRKLSQLNLVILQDAFNQLATDTMRADCKSLLVDMLNRAVETELLNKNIALGTGMRMGEILGLTWDCIDFENGVIKVEKTLCYLPNNGNAIYEFHRPKTKAGRRNIPMTKEVRDILLKQKERYV